MKKLDRVLDIGPTRAEQLERNGIRTLKDIATCENLPDLSAQTGISLEMLQQWQALASQKVAASRYRGRIGLIIGLVVLAALILEVRPFFQSPNAEAEGDAFYEQGNYEKALGRYSKAIEFNPNSATAYGSKGSALRMLSRYQEAEKALNKAIQLDPKSVWTYNELGALYTDEKQYENAVVEYDKALTIDPNYKYAYAKAFPLRMLGHYQEAVAALTKAIEIDPSWTWPYIERASIFHDHLFQYDSAYHDLEKASQTSNTLDIQADFAEAALTAGHFEQAYQLATQLLAQNEKTDTNTFEVSERCAMRLIAISALMLQNQQATAKAPLEKFIAYYKANENALRRNWEYAGTQHYIASHKIDAASRRLMLSLIELLQLEPKVGIDAIEELLPNLPNPRPSSDSALTPTA